MAGDFRGAPHADMTGAERVLEPGVGPLDDRADAVSDGSGVGMAGGSLGPGLAIQGLLEGLVAAGVGGNDRDRAETFADRVYLRRVTGTVHEVVEVRDPAVMVARGMATRESCREAEVRMAPSGTPQSAVSTGSLQPRQVSRIPRAFFFVPRSQTFGRSASIASRLMPPACRLRRDGVFGLSSPLRGRPGRRFATAASRPSMAVAFRDT